MLFVAESAAKQLNGADSKTKARISNKYFAFRLTNIYLQYNNDNYQRSNTCTTKPCGHINLTSWWIHLLKYIVTIPHTYNNCSTSSLLIFLPFQTFRDYYLNVKQSFLIDFHFRIFIKSLLITLLFIVNITSYITRHLYEITRLVVKPINHVLKSCTGATSRYQFDPTY